jgi:hypothetical protein
MSDNMSLRAVLMVGTCLVVLAIIIGVVLLLAKPKATWVHGIAYWGHQRPPWCDDRPHHAMRMSQGLRRVIHRDLG